MKLRIIFSGLELFVPVPASDGNPDTMYVVMPAAPGHHGEDHHFPMLVFNAAHLTEGNALKGQSQVFRPLDGLVLTVDGPDAGAGLKVCNRIVNLKSATNTGIDPTVLAKDDNLRAVARVDLRAGAMQRVAEGACWEWESGTMRPMAHRAEWVVEGLADDKPLQLVLSALHNAPSTEIPPLYPLIGGTEQVINLHILHLPAADLFPGPDMPMMPEPGSEPHHFDAYYRLYATRVPEWRPRFHDAEGTCGVASDNCGILPRYQGSSPYNCMLGGTWPQP